MVEEKSFSKILEWMEKFDVKLNRVIEIQLDHSAKLETLYEVTQESIKTLASVNCLS